VETRKENIAGKAKEKGIARTKGKTAGLKKGNNRPKKN